MNIRNVTRTEFILQQGEDAILGVRWIRRRRRTSLPLEPAITLDQQLGKSLDKDFGQAACRNLRNLEHDPEKWMPVFRKDHAPAKNLDHDPIQPDRIMV